MRKLQKHYSSARKEPKKEYGSSKANNAEILRKLQNRISKAINETGQSRKEVISVLSIGIEPIFATSQAAVLSIERRELSLKGR